MVVITKVDTIHPSLQQNIPLIFKSKELQRKVKEIAAFMGFPEGNVLLSRNYFKEKESDIPTNILALWNLQQMMHACDTTLHRNLRRGTHLYKPI